MLRKQTTNLPTRFSQNCLVDLEQINPRVAKEKKHVKKSLKKKIVF